MALSPAGRALAVPGAFRWLDAHDPLTPGRARALLTSILLLGLLCRVALIVMKGPGYHFADTAEYDAAARALLTGNAASEAIPRAPLYPAFMALVYRFAGPGNFPAVRVVQLLFGLSLIWLTAVLGRRLGAPRVGLLAAFGVAIAPTLVYTSTMVYPNTLYAALILGCTVLAHRLDARPGVKAALLFGLLAGLAWLTDQVAAAPIAALLVWIAFGVRRRGRRALLALLVCVLSSGAVVAGWSVRKSGDATPRIFFAKAQYVLFEARHDPGVVSGHAVRDGAGDTFRPLSAREFVTRETRLMREQPLAYAHDYAFEFAHFFDPSPDRIQTVNVYTGRFARTLVTIYFLPVLVLALIGAFAGIAPGRDRLLLALVPLSTAALYAFFFTQMRYRVPTEPQLLLLAALGARRLMRRYPRRVMVQETAESAGRAPAPREATPA
jgi:Dolichyl-phosphate-mannose-protein mannosyltransferase